MDMKVELCIIVYRMDVSTAADLGAGDPQYVSGAPVYRVNGFATTQRDFAARLRECYPNGLSGWVEADGC
jgi:hypothetical protein